MLGRNRHHEPHSPRRNKTEIITLKKYEMKPLIRARRVLWFCGSRFDLVKESGKTYRDNDD